MARPLGDPGPNAFWVELVPGVLTEFVSIAEEGRFVFAGSGATV